MRGGARLAALYAVFALIATAVNIGCQAVVIWAWHGPYAVPLSILVGTGAGLPVKYLLEKRHIFGFESDGLAHDGKLFVLYSVMGVFTTAVFWGVEFAFSHLYGTDAMRYVGGALGLTIGNLIKYQLDKRYVFVAAAAPLAEAV
ncbi:GtrA family protein [Duganella sp. BJB488]|uniref:GtrA family protein n=1 Tax=unclassified Duganella TaxID=2636909 RepID=UPI000E342C59|nr:MULTISPECIES: GtrA family protein [unclassified Duganella]RFP14144.1 GtrA family protein [Duganella sp. BJB489]RFP17273.1 GtrA family protein [Duganella sp. BJB488]RFP31938.1 GtrA family protein [Duganella sp. BJB480]